MSITNEVRSVLEAAKGKNLPADLIESLVNSYERQESAIKRLIEGNRALRDAVELYRMKASHLEEQLHLLKGEKSRPAAARLQYASPPAHKLSTDARRILSGLAEQERSGFWSGEISALSRGLSQPDIAEAIGELLDHDVIEEISYTAFEGTHYRFTAQGDALMRHLFHGRR